MGYVMLRSVVKPFAPPKYDLDDPHTQAARALHMVTLGIALIIVCATGITVLFGQQKISSLTINGTVLAICLVTLRELRQSRIQQASLIFVTSTWLLVVVFVGISGGLSHFGPSLFVVVIAMAALFLDWRFGVVITLVTVLYALVLAFLRSMDVYLPVLFALDGTQSWMLFAEALLLVLVPVIIMNNGLVEALRYAREHLAEREKAESSLRQSEERYRTVVELIWDYVFADDVLPDGSLQNAWITEEPYQRVTGYDWSETTDHFALYHPDDLQQVKQDVAQTVQGIETNGEYRIVKPDGSTRWISVRRKAVWDEKRSRVVRIYGAAQDITQQKEAERSRLQFAVEKERHEAFEKMISGVSHDIKTPLMVISTGLYVLEKSADLDQRKRSLDSIRQQTLRLRDYVEDLLAVAKLDAHRQLRLTNVDVEQLMGEIRSDLDPIAVRKRLTLRTDTCAEPPPLHADGNLLRRAIVNVVQNAIAYTPEGGEVMVVTRLVGGCIEIEVKDTGIGISDADLPNIFQPFYRGSEGETLRREGTGLGLAVVQDVVKRHGGAIQVASKVGEGSTFRIQLPVTPIQPCEESLSPFQETESAESRLAV